MSQEIPQKQRAWVVVRRGAPRHAVELKTDWPVPKDLNDGEVLVKVQAAAFNPVGYKMMKLLPNFLAGRPHIAEGDFAGEVVDARGSDFKKGDQVYGWVPFNVSTKTGQGALAEYIRVSQEYIVERPLTISPLQSAGLTLAGQTAWQALVTIGQIESGQSIFINGGSTAVGAFAIQIAKAKGVKVTATYSPRTEDFVRRLGPDVLVNYKDVILPKYLAENPPTPKFHVILDAVGVADPSLYTSSEAYLAPNGIFITTGPMPQAATFGEIWKLVKTAHASLAPVWLGGMRRRYVSVLTSNRHRDLEDFRNLVAEGKIKPVIDSVRSFEDVYLAYDQVMSGRAMGKIEVLVDPTSDSY